MTSKFLKNQTVSIVGCPFSGGQGRGGVDTGPNSLIKAGLVQQLKDLNWNVNFKENEKFDYVNEMLSNGNDQDIGKMKNPRTVSKVTKQVSDVIERESKAGNLPLTLGGDHSLALGTIAGSLRSHPDIGVLWIDAHADLNTPLTTPSGNLHGCPVSFLLGLEGTNVEPFSEWLPKDGTGAGLKPDSIVYIGLRDIDSGEKKLLKENGIKSFSMHEVDRYGIGKVVEMALSHLNKKPYSSSSDEIPTYSRPIHLSFDVDALDPSVAPSTGTPVRGGLTFREGHYICERVWETGCLAALDLMEVNPSLMQERDAEQTIAVGCSLIRAAMGETLL